jgi:hypothetical protein
MPQGKREEKPGDIFRDDPSIPDDMRVLHRIPPGRVVEAEDRPNSSNFDNSRDGSGTSVDLMEDEEQPTRTLADFPDFGLVSITVGELRALNLGVVRDPIKGDDQNKPNDKHALIQGNKKKAKQKIARQCKWITYPAKPEP